MIERRFEENNKKEYNFKLALIEIQNLNYEKAIVYLKKEIKLNPKHTKSKKLLEKLQINSNFPTVTLALLFLKEKDLFPFTLFLKLRPCIDIGCSISA